MCLVAVAGFFAVEACEVPLVEGEDEGEVVWVAGAEVCAKILPGSSSPAANRVMAVVRVFCIGILSHCPRNSANCAKPIHAGHYQYIKFYRVK